MLSKKSDQWFNLAYCNFQNVNVSVKTEIKTVKCGYNLFKRQMF